jgi:hypothetical protein
VKKNFNINAEINNLLVTNMQGPLWRRTSKTSEDVADSPAPDGALITMNTINGASVYHWNLPIQKPEPVRRNSDISADKER